MVYCVEDDAAIQELVLYALSASGFAARGFESAAALDGALLQQKPALLLLDVMLPGEDGLSLLRRLRAAPQTARLPIILLTAKSAEYDKVIGLDNGADDYVCKPFGVLELISRVRAVMRRTEPFENFGLLTVGSVTLCEEQHMVHVQDEEIALTNREFELLRFLMQNRGLVLTRDRLLDAVWNCGYEGESRTIDVHIATLRQKLGEAGRLIETVRGVGYRMEEGRA
ncbi:MAG: response regulator transcription factor [Oscillospiraceae bacterium]